MVSLIEHEKSVPLGKNFRIWINQKLGSGSFGEVYKGFNTKSSENIAVKIESLKNNTLTWQYEASVINYLQGGEGIPRCYNLIKTPQHNCLVMNYIGSNLESLLSKCQRNFSLKTVCMLGIQMWISDLQSGSEIRKLGLITRKKEGQGLIGTARYSSIYTHFGIEQSRRDDLESIMYTLIYLFNGTLPWQGITAKTKLEKYNKIMEKKINVPVSTLCQGLPSEFIKIISYIRDMQYEDRPNYDYITSVFMSMMQENSYTCDWIFDWNISTRADVSKINYVKNDSRHDENDIQINNLTTVGSTSCNL